MRETIGKLGEASVIVTTWVEHDTIFISPKEEQMMVFIIELLEALRKMKADQESISECILKVNPAKANYLKGKEE